MFELDLTLDEVIDTLASAIDPICGVCYQSQDNRVPMPIDQFCILTPIVFKRISTTKTTSVSIGSAALYSEIRQLDVQLDVYGDRSAERAIAVETVFRSGLLYDIIQSKDKRIAPLYSSTATQAAMINSEAQWQNRYLVMLSLQVNMTLIAKQKYFDSVEFSLYEVDVNNH